MKRQRLRMNINPFKGRLKKLVLSKTSKAEKFTQEEILEFEEQGLEVPKVKRRTKEWAYVFNLYSYLIEIDQHFISMMSRVAKTKTKKTKTAGIYNKYISAFRYIKKKHKRSVQEDFLNNHRITKKLLADLEKFLIVLANDSSKSSEEKMSILRKYVRSSVYKKKLMESYTRFVGQCLTILNYKITTAKKKNKTLNLPYIQFALTSNTEEILSKSSMDQVEERNALKKIVKIQENELKQDLIEKNLIPETRPFFITNSEGDSEKHMIMVGFDPAVENIPDQPTSSDFDSAEEYKEALVAWKKLRDSYICEAYSPVMRQESGDGYQVYEDVESLKNGIKQKRKEEALLESIKPRVIPPSKKNPDFAVIEFPESDQGIQYSVMNYNSLLNSEEAEGALTSYRQISDRKGEEKGDVTKVFPVKRLLVGDQEVDIIADGPYKGYKFDDMVNVMGRLVDNEYFDSEGNPIKLIDLSLEAEDMLSGKGFLDIERSETTKSGYTVTNNKLVEPYVTVDGEGRLMIGIPKGSFYKNDRTELRGLEKSKLVKQHEGLKEVMGRQFGSNPFYTFTPENFDVVKSKLGSFAMSKPALDLIKQYKRNNEARSRALNEENVSRFDSSFLGGFKEEVFGKKFDFNDKQKEGMAWVEANGFQGVVALDTGVGKTLFAGGTMQNYMNRDKELQEEFELDELERKKKLKAQGKPYRKRKFKADTKKFLFVSPKRLVGNFSAEMYDFMKDHSVIESRIEEIAYFNLARRISAMNNMAEALEPGFPKSKRDYRFKQVEGTDFLNEKKTKMNYEDANDFFVSNYSIIFFDEINDALKPSTKKSVSELEHPRKILLTASPMEKDPLDLYRFVSIAKGIKPDKKKESNFLKDYSYQIGGRFVGITKDPEKRQLFEKWVAENAYFALKEDVDLPKVNMPRLLKPTYKTIRLGMDAKVKKAYKEKSAKYTKDLKAMVRKYRDLIKLNKMGKMSQERLDQEMQDVVDFAVVGLSDLQELQILATNPDSVIPGVGNPKIEESIAIANHEDRKGKTILYFSHLEDVVTKNAQSLSAKVEGIHVAMKDNTIEFFKEGKKIKTVNKSTSIKDLLDINEFVRRTASLNPKVVVRENSTSEPQNSDLNRAVASILGGAILTEIKVYKNKVVDDVSAPGDFVPWIDVPLIVSEYEERKDPKQWAIGASKLIFKNNESIRTITCNDEYARGFNFQFATTVVHLDRGKEIDSELIKQRTARAYRTKQDQRVEVLFLDAVMHDPDGKKLKEVEIEDGVTVTVNCNEDQTIDEIQELVQGVDQDFFMGIIKKAMKADLGEDGLKEEVAETYRMNKNLLSQILDPSPENLSRVKEQLRKEQENPLLTSVKDPARFISTNIKSAFDTVVDEDTLENNLDLSGMSAFTAYNFSDDTTENVVREDYVSSNGRFLKQETRFEEDEFGMVSIKNENLTVTRCAPKGTGTKIIVAQITSALDQGNVKEISVNTNKEDMTYYIYPKMGFNAQVTLDFLTFEEGSKARQEEETTEEGRIQIKIRDWFEGNRRNIGANGEVALLDLYACTDNSNNLIGQDWWEKNGYDVEMSIDLSSTDSASLKFINQYFTSKCQQQNVPTDEFLSADSEPFDVDQPACWLNYAEDIDSVLDGRGRPVNPAKIINTYFDQFKVAYSVRADIQEAFFEYLEELPKTKQEELLRVTGSEMQDPTLQQSPLSRYASQREGMLPVHIKDQDNLLDNLWVNRSQAIQANTAYIELLEDQNDDVYACQIEME